MMKIAIAADHGGFALKQKLIEAFTPKGYQFDDLGTNSEESVDYPDYADDLDDRRVDYYSAASIQRGVLELGSNRLSNQFDVLKEEIFDGVKDTARKSHPNGYERMLSVMEQAVKISAPNYLLSSSPYWISGKIKKGVCHYLVNDHKLRWVKKKHG